MRHYCVWLLAVCGLGLTGCASTLPSIATPLAMFKTSPVNPNQKLYKAPEVNLGHYHALKLDPLMFMQQQQDGKLVVLQAGAQNDIGNYYLQSLRKALLVKGVPVSEQAAPGVATQQAAVTGMDLSQPDLKLRDLLPVKVAINVTKDVVGKEPYLLNISSMSRLVDSQSGQLLVSAINVRQDKETITRDHPVTLQDIQPLIDDWCLVTASQLAAHLGKS